MEISNEPISAEDLYKSFVQRDDPSSYLLRFVTEAENFNSKISEYDLVKNYLYISGNCKEILQLVKEISDSDSQRAVLMMKTLYHILIRVAGDLCSFMSVGTSIVNEILTHGMKSIFNFLKFKQKSSRTKISLHLLSSMIAIGGPAAHNVVSKLDFTHITFTHLLNRKNFSDEEDVRTAFINLIIILMQTCDSRIIRQLVEIKGFLNDILPGLISDKAEVITLVLSTFRKLIVENTSITKTTKIRLFNDHSLKSVLKLYSWKGPIRTKNHKRKLGQEEQPIAYEVSDEEAESVHNCAHQFMLSLCCSFKTGIIFNDPSYGASGKNHNTVLTNILKAMPKPHTNQLACDFVISVLKTCPDQMVYYLPLLKDSFMPRLTTQWVNAINVMQKIILAQDPVSCIFKSEKKPVSTLIIIAKSLCFPNVIAPSELINIFKNDQFLVCYHLCDFLMCVLNQIQKVNEFCTNGNFTEIPYSSAEISTFNQSFLSTIIQNFTFMKDLEGFFTKITSTYTAPSEKTADTDLETPSLSNQLLKILQVIQLFLDVYRGCHDYNLNVPKLFQSFKECHSFLSREEICNINIKIVDIIAVQGEETVTLWNKKLTDSPLMVLLDVYLTSPSLNMIEDVSKILHKVLMHTKIFEYCPWEINVWLESMKSSKAKHVPFIIEFINQSMCNLLENSNMFADDIIENTFGNRKPRTLDVTSMLNDLLSEEKDPVLIEDLGQSESVLSTEKQYFSSLVPAALYTLKSVEDHRRKGCQSFVEKVLYHVMHHQQSPEVLFTVFQKYKTSISSSLYEYSELLCSSRFVKMMEQEDVPVCKIDLADHLKMKFLTLHTLQNSPKGCHCDIQCEPQQLNDSYKEKIIWQLLTYIDWETTLLLEDKIKNTALLNYLHLLESLLSSFGSSQVASVDDEIMEVCDEIPTSNKSAKFKMLQDSLSRPVILKLFLWTEKVPKSKRHIFQDFVNCATRLVLNLTSEIALHEEFYKSLSEYKEKVVKFNSFIFQTVNLHKHAVMHQSSDICNIIGRFSALLSANDIAYLLEDMLNLEVDGENAELYFSTLLLIFKMYIETKDIILLSPRAINSSFVIYVNMSKKCKNILRTYIVQVFEKHPILASAVEADSCHMLLKQVSNKNFYLLGSLIDYSDRLRKIIQLAILENLEALRESPDFIFLVSKCILNSSINEAEDEHFQNTIASLFWEAISSHILIDVTSSDMLMESCGAGKAIGVIFQRNVLAVKKLTKFFKNNEELLKSSLPSPSKMLIFLQFMEIIKTYVESRKSAVSILKTTFHWFTSVLSSTQNFSQFNYGHLFKFTLNLLQNIPYIQLQSIVEVKQEQQINSDGDLKHVEVFLQTILKVALKSTEIGHELIEILTSLYQKSEDLPTKLVFNLITGHSKFFNIMLSNLNEDLKLKESIIDLLIALVSADKSVCKDNHLGLFLSAYSATLKSIDQKLLYLIKLYSESDVDLAKFSPFIWGTTAIAYYSVMNSGSMQLWKRAKLQDVLSILLLDKMQTTVEMYPLTLKLEPSVAVSSEELENCSQPDRVYDLRFMLPLLANLLSPGSFVHCRSFMDSRVLMLIFTSLSSFDANTRALGYYCLSQLYSHIESAYYGEKRIWLCLLDAVRHSITTENPRIPSIVSLFLAKVTQIFTKPDHSLYNVIYEFIMVKPNLDIGQVPEFYKLFNSIDIEHRVQRLWLLRLLADGLRSSLDFHICEKRYIFSTLLTHYSSPISSPEEKVEILNIISATVKIDSSARILSQNGLLCWLHTVIENLNTADVALLKGVSILLKNLWFTSKECLNMKPFQEQNQDNQEKDEADKKPLYISFPNEFQLILLNFLKKLKMLDISVVNIYLSTLLDVNIFMKCYSDSGVLTPFHVSSDHIAEMLMCWHMIADKAQHTDDSISTVKAVNNVSDIQQCSLYFSKLILFWSPNWEISGQNYNRQLLMVVKAVELMLRFHGLSSVYTSDLPTWLYRCFKEDKKCELVKLFLSTQNKTCLKFILIIFEKSLSVPSQFSNTKASVELCPELKVNTFKQWKKILLHFKKVCKTYSLTPELNLYDQITVIL